MNVRLGFTINWATFGKTATSFDFTQHHFDRLTFLVLTNCYMIFPCPDCVIAFDTKRTLFKHIREVHKREPSLCAFTCGHCNSDFTTSKNLLRHLRNVHKFGKTIRCNACPKTFGHESTLCNHRAAERPTFSTSTSVNEIEWASVPQVSKVVSALNSRFKVLRLDVQQEGVDPFSFMMSNRSDIALLIDKELTNQGISRVGLCIQVAFPNHCMGKMSLPAFPTVITCCGVYR